MADADLTGLTAATTLNDDDLLYALIDPSGTPLDRKITVANAQTTLIDTAAVTAAGALMDSEVDADIKTLVLPASTTISAFGATLVDDADAATARTTLTAAEDYVAPALVTGTTDTLTATDHATTIRYNNASAVTVTIPLDAAEDLPDGFWCTLYAEGAGGVTVSFAGTLTGSAANTAIVQNEAMVVQKTATADTWMVIGATA